MRIVFYYNSSYVSVFLLTAMDDLIKKGHAVCLLTTSPPGDLHEHAEKLGAKVFSAVSNGIYNHCRTLVKFCRQHQIDFVFSHLQYPNLVAVLSQYFIKASVWPMRHHADDVYLSGNKNALKLDKSISILSKKILVVSNVSKKHMVSQEGVSEKKIIVLPLYYNFDFYPACESYPIHSTADDTLNLVSVGRMVANKNHADLLNVIKRLTNEGINVKLVLLDTGPLENELKKFVSDSNLNDRVAFLGRQNDVMKHICAADLLVHPSISESGPQVIKEAGICQKPVVAVKDVGDVDEYIVDGQNGFLLSRDNIQQELYMVLKRVYADRLMLVEMGKELDKAVRRKFELTPETKTYEDIINGTIA
jgi:glycosyltransferase involved in cell wall biosynthesis